jgi:hypothetical protein
MFASTSRTVLGSLRVARAFSVSVREPERPGGPAAGPPRASELFLRDSSKSPALLHEL